MNAIPQEQMTPETDVGQPVLDPEEARVQAEEAEQRRREALDAVGAQLEGLKDKAVSYRVDFEHRWFEDYRQYRGDFGVLPAKEGSANNTTAEEDDFRKTRDNITRPKVIITVARLGDMLFPTNDINWDMEPSPRPVLVDPAMAKFPDGVTAETATPAQKRTAVVEAAKKACTGMKEVIEDQLEESSYADNGRSAIFDACLYGTGVLKGPVPKFCKRYVGGGGRAEIVEEPSPTAEYVDLWNFYPQPCRKIDEAEHTFELHLKTRKGVRKLADHPGFDKAQIRRLLDMAPQHGALAGAVTARGNLRPDTTIQLDAQYSVWEYRGPLPKAAFRDFMVGLYNDGSMTEADFAEVVAEAEKDPLNEIECEVWFCQGVVIKCAMAVIDLDHPIYYVFNYEPDPDSIFGFGVPSLCRDDQIAANQMWHAIMLNSMMSAGPQIGVRKEALVATSNGAGRATKLTATKPRVWAMTEDVKDIREALSVFIVPNVTGPLLGVYDRVKANADEHTLTPLIAQGEPTAAVPTSSGLAMLMNAANVVMRRLAKQWDDRVTNPLVCAFYDWNMAHNPDPSIKGDYKVIPKGASYLLIKDVKAQHIQYATTLLTGNPALGAYAKGRKLAAANLEIIDLNPEDFLYTEEEVQQSQQGKGPDPETMKATAQAEHAKAAQMRAQADMDRVRSDAEHNEIDRQLDHEERMADIESRERVAAMQFEGQKLALATAMARMESAERVAMEKIIAGMRIGEMNVAAKREHTHGKLRLDAERIAQDDEKLRVETRVETPVRLA